ncbi:branched-chain amino acid ABC transporter permease [Methanotorris igneus]|uniref:ABC-type transporter, integral membrane subunit n=1 Tax=Methanotorris igneus (strain DSM 5666 / JCM 11834 / Kol 5) TaxID=880724 RepID=F6BCN8_METIK|nr:branched-chain amino acid ABC transporter permease [Methanotorris igneus]AEF96249.1 ABC-type transporter, integral membrane subunit [Methanotorris igneus Kol 5]
MDITNYILDFIVHAGIFAILAVSLNLEFGYTGLSNFGKVAFFAIGAYTAALSNPFLPFPLNIILGVIIAGIAGFLISIPSLKLRDDYLAIVTIAFGEILRLIFNNEKWTGGASGWTNIQYFDLKTMLIIVLIAFIGVFIFSEKLVNSPFGRLMKAVREDEIATKALGKDTFLIKAKTLGVGSALAGIAGGLYAHYLGYISPDMFMPIITFLIWMMVIIGGKANNYGVLVGVLIVDLIERGTQILGNYDLPIEPANLRMILIGLLLILFVMYRPYGLIPEKPMKIGEIE